MKAESKLSIKWKTPSRKESIFWATQEKAELKEKVELE
jgi:hypothetical protein